MCIKIRDLQQEKSICNLGELKQYHCQTVLIAEYTSKFINGY